MPDDDDRTKEEAVRDMYTYVCRCSYSISEHMSIPPNITADPVLYIHA